MQTDNWPFDQLLVDHLFYGTTRIWWRMNRYFNDTAPYLFQLQAGYTSNPHATDWISIGAVATNVDHLDDDTGRERYGNVMFTHYRVVLTTANARYTSQPIGIFGTLTESDWRQANEILRKEDLRLQKVGRPGYLLHRFRYGKVCKASTDSLTGVIIDSDHPQSYGTEFEVGYHPAIPLIVDIAPTRRLEMRGATNPEQNNARPRQIKARIAGYYAIYDNDVWVDATTDERWNVDTVDNVGAVRGVPVAYEVQMSLIPFSNVIYKFPVTELSIDPSDSDAGKTQPLSGSGCVLIDHDYTGTDELQYQGGDCCGIAGAEITAFTKADWDLGHRSSNAVVATSHTNANGRWAWAMKLNPGVYVLKFERIPDFGPDIVEVTVTAPEPESDGMDSESIGVSEGDQGSEQGEESPPVFTDAFGQF